MKKKIIIIAAVAVVALIAVFLKVRTTYNQNVLVLSGTVEVTDVNVGFKNAGRIRKLYTDEARPVIRGDRIAELDSAEFESVANQNRASVRNAEAQWEKARNDFERYARLYQEGAISSQQMDAAKTTLEMAESQLKMWRASLATAEVRLRDATIYAPLNGIVLRKNTEEGEIVAAGTPVFTIGDLADPWIKVYMKEDKLGFIKLGQKAAISVDSFPNKIYEGVVTFISSEAEFTPKNVQTSEDRVKLVFGIKVSVKNQNDELKPGMPADVRIQIK